MANTKRNKQQAELDAKVAARYGFKPSPEPTAAQRLQVLELEVMTLRQKLTEVIEAHNTFTKATCEDLRTLQATDKAIADATDANFTRISSFLLGGQGV